MSSSSTIEAFGEPRSLWREDSASRKDPLVKKGKKRKSDELVFEDEFGDNAILRLSQSSFTAIDTFPENTSEREEEGRLMIKDESGSRRKTYSSGSKTVRYQDMRTNPDENLKQDIPQQLRTIGKVKTCQIKNEPEDHICVETEMPMSCGVAVADSEDEDEDMTYSEPHDTIKAESADVGFSTLEVDITKKEPSQEENGESGAKALLEIPVPQPEHATFVASPFQRDSPTKFRSAEQRNHPTMTATKTSSTLTISERHAVQSFLCYDTYKIQKYLDSLHQSRRTAAEAIYNCLIEGGEPTDEMQKLTPSISTKINAMDSLLRLRDNYVKLTREKERIKSRMLIAIQKDHSMDQHTQDVAMSIKLTSQLFEIEKSILELLVQATLPLADQKPTPCEGQKDGCSRGSNTIICTRSLVQSTQSSQPKMDDPTQNPHSSAPPTMQFVEQTQIPNLRPHPNKEEDGRQFLSRERVNVPSNSSSPTKGAKDYSNTPKSTHFTDIGIGAVQVHDIADRRETVSRVGNWGSEFESRKAKFDEGDKPFMTHMGTPTRYGLMDEEFGEDENDEDMLEFAEEFESRDSKPQPNTGADQRSVFTETSGNAVMGNNQRPRSDIMDMSSQSTQLQFKWSNEVKSAMKNRFRLHGFRPNQLEAVNATLAGKDAFVLMPTGGGKSLCYQLPSIIKSGKTRGVTVVISPLLSLMQDQVDHLQKLKIQALLFNGEVTSDHRRLVMDALKDIQPEKFVQLLYITPEMITKSQKIIQAFNDLYRRQKLARIVIDEAHCVSQWGHDFRPDYKQLGQVRRQFPDVPVMALTATATENVKVDVIHNLGIQGCEIFTQSFNRPNLTYEVRTKGKLKDVLESMVSIIGTFYKNQSGIIYCLSRQNCEKISERLQKDYQIRAHHYHAGMEPDQKSQVQKAWQAGKYHVIVATIAFGMGIDKADVRFVIHHTIPKSLEGYYQETGRAGRDGKRSGCYLFYGYQDTSSLKRMINDGEGSWEQKERQHKMLRNVIQFCENKSDCRRVQILNYFNESFCSEDCHGGCDNCNSSSTFESQDFTEHAKAAIRLVSSIQSHDVTLLHCVDVFRGHKNKKITDRGHHELQEFGVGASLERGDAERLFYRLLSEDALMEHHLVNKAGFALQYVKVRLPAPQRFPSLVFSSSARTARNFHLAEEKSRSKFVFPQNVRRQHLRNRLTSVRIILRPRTCHLRSTIYPGDVSRKRLNQSLYYIGMVTHETSLSSAIMIQKTHSNCKKLGLRGQRVAAMA